MDQCTIFMRLVSLYEKEILDEDCKNDFLLALQEGIKENKINNDNLKEIEVMTPIEIIDYVNDQLRLF